MFRLDSVALLFGAAPLFLHWTQRKTISSSLDWLYWPISRFSSKPLCKKYNFQPMRWNLSNRALQTDASGQNSYWKGWLSTVDLLIEIASFVKIKRAWYDIVSTRRSTVLHCALIGIPWFWVNDLQTISRNFLD
jgi:hypothetical protein